MKEKYCKNCLHFCQHYVLDSRRIFQVHCGHCTYLRIRNKVPDAPACKSFVPSLPDKEAFVTKEYLSKILLDYMVQLDLLPPIEEFNDQI